MRELECHEDVKHEECVFSCSINLYNVCHITSYIHAYAFVNGKMPLNSGQLNY